MIALWALAKPAAAGAWRVLRAVPWWVWLAAALCVLWAVERRQYGNDREAAGRAAVQARWDMAERDHAQREMLLVEHARQRETKAREAYAAAVESLQQENRHAIAERDAVLADAAAGRLRLRDRFRCPTAQPAAGVPATAAGPVGRDAPEGAFLSGADQEFLVRIGAEADEVTRQLQACQRILTEDRRK
jgi:prophage endopeptidase